MSDALKRKALSGELRMGENLGKLAGKIWPEPGPEPEYVIPPYNKYLGMDAPLSNESTAVDPYANFAASGPNLSTEGLAEFAASDGLFWLLPGAWSIYESLKAGADKKRQKRETLGKMYSGDLDISPAAFGEAFIEPSDYKEGALTSLFKELDPYLLPALFAKARGIPTIQPMSQPAQWVGRVPQIPKLK